MRCRFLTAAFALALAVSSGTAHAGAVERLALWQGLEQWLAGEGGGFIVPTVETTGWKGFISEGNRLRGMETGDEFRYVFDRGGTFYLGVVLTDDPDGIEHLRVTLNGRELGTIVGADDSGKAIYSFAEPFAAKKGDALVFTCMNPVGCYRIYDLVFARKRILPPEPSFKYIETWSAKPGVVDICWTTTGIVKTGRVEYSAQGVKQTSYSASGEGRNHRIRLRGLDPDVEYKGRIVTTWQGVELASEPFTFRPVPAKPAETKPQAIDLAVSEPASAPRQDWPTTLGVPFGLGMLASVNDLALASTDGRDVLFQAEATSLWYDGSVKWAKVSFLANTEGPDKPVTRRLVAAPGRQEENRPAPVLEVRESGEGWELRTSAMRFRVGKEGPAFFGGFGFDANGDGSVAQDEWVAGGETAGLVIEPEDGQVHACAAPDTVETEENGPVRAVVKCSGALRSPQGDGGWRYLLRLTFWRGMPGMGVNVTFWNGEQEPLFRKVRRVSVNVPLPTDSTPMRLFQDTDNHYTVERGGDRSEGERARGLVTVGHGKGVVSLLVRDFWQTYPSALELNAEGMQVDLLPALEPGAYTIEGDEGWFHRLYQWFDDGCYLMRAGQTAQQEFYLWFDESAAAANHRAECFEKPLLPQASPEYLCATRALGRDMFPKTPGVWDEYESFFEGGFDGLTQAREADRMYGWMNFGDWYGERGYNAGNNEYDLAWCLAMQWMRTGDRRYFDRGLEMARHYATVDTIRGDWADQLPGVVWEHSFNHVGTRRSPDELGFDEHARGYAKSEPGTFQGGMDPQGHIFEDGVWIYGLLTGEQFLLDTADRVCTRQAEFLTPTFDFEIERGGGWPLINAGGAYLFTGNPYFLNAARIMVQRCLERHDPEHGGWPHVPPPNETLGTPVVGGKAFATGVLTFGLLRYLNVEPVERPDVSQMLLNTADWLMDESWEPGNGFVYITNSPKHVGQGHRGHECTMNADVIGYAYEATGDAKYRDFWEEMMRGAFDHPLTGFGKGFSQGARQTIFGLDRARKAGINACKPLEEK